MVLILNRKYLSVFLSPRTLNFSFIKSKTERLTKELWEFNGLL
jgi:hypothetical protein